MGTTTTTTKAFSPSTLHSIYNQIKTYPFSTDLEFQSGLRAILSHHTLTSSEIRTRTLQAQCFYISRKNNVIPLVDVEAYVNWLRQSGEEDCVPNEKGEEKVEDEEESGGKSGGGGGDEVKILSATSSTTTTTTKTTTEEPPPPYTSPPPYPQSFSHLVELITTGQTIPGIKEVPNTLLTGQGSKAVESKRRKPWEVHREVEMEELGEGEMEE